MMHAGGWLRVLRAIARRDTAIAMTDRSAYLTRPLGVIFTLALFYFVSRLVSVTRFPTADAYFAFVAIGIVIYGMVRSSLDVPVRVRDELLGRTFERLELSPAGSAASVVGMLVFPSLYALLLAAYTIVIAALVYGLDVQWSTAPLGIPIGLLGALAFSPFALVLAALTLMFKHAPGQGVVLPTIALVSGLYFPVDLLPDSIRWLSEVQPLTPTVDLMRHVLVGTSLAEPGVELAKLGGFVLIGVPLAVLAVAAALRYCRRRGTILES
jgi:ABC-2 type transport system permease protein